MKNDHTTQPLKGKTILQVLPALDSGGVEVSTVDAAAAIVAAGGTALVASAGGRWVNEIIRSGGKPIILPLKSKNPINIWRNKKRLMRIIRDYNVDLVHARSRAPAWSAYWAARACNVPFMTTFHAAYGFGSALKKKYNSVMARGVRIIAISNYIAQHILDHYAVDSGIIRIVYRGVALEKFHPKLVHPERMVKLAREWQVPEDKQLIVMPSRLTRLKGHVVLLEALAKMTRRDFFCVICGAGETRSHYHQELLDLIAKYNLEDRVRIVGFCADVPAAMRLAQIMVAPTLVPEGFGRMPVEAQAMGTPVVASAIGGHKEIIIDGETGFLVPPDNAAAMAAAMDRVMGMDDTARATLATKAMHFVTTHFTREQMMSQTVAVYSELVGPNLNIGPIVTLL